MRFAYTFITLLIYLASYCSNAVAHPKNEKHFNLANTAWRLVEFESMNDEIGVQRPKDSSSYTAKFNRDGSIEMRLDCNSASGRWSAEAAADGYSGALAIGPLATTRMLCPRPSMGEQLARHAEYIKTYLIKDQRLYLSLMADAGTYVWQPLDEDAERIKMTAPEQGGPRNWALSGVTSALNLRAGPSLTSTVVSQLTPDSILDNLGCKDEVERTWCYVQKLGGGHVGYVAAEYLLPAMSPDGSVAAGPDNSSLRASQGDFDATGVLPCSVSRDQAMSQCQFGVARAGGGYATVVVYKSDGRTRSIYFQMGMPISAATSQAEGSPEFSASQHGDLNLVAVGQERFEIPSAIVFGD